MYTLIKVRSPFHPSKETYLSLKTVYPAATIHPLSRLRYNHVLMRN